MNDFVRNVEKLVLQFNMQSRKVRIAALTDRRSSQRYSVAMRMYMMGRINLLDFMSAVSEKNYAKRNFISAIQTYWSLHYTLRSMTAYDFETNRSLTEQLPLN